jgi:pilus assembly protein CpaF
MLNHLALDYLKPVMPLLESANVTEVMVNGPNKVFVKRYGSAKMAENVIITSDAISSAITALASGSNRQVGIGAGTDGFRIISAQLPGYRIEAWLPPVAVMGPCLTIRKLGSSVFPLEKLVERSLLTPEIAEYLRNAVLLRKNIFLAGGTGSGKTTLANSLLAVIPDDERMIVIETIHELNLHQENVLYFEADAEQGVTVRRLIKSAMRGFPDRIIVGEVRGEEAYDLIYAAKSGHPGTVATLHADDSRSILEKLEDMCVEGQPNLPLSSHRKNIASAAHVLGFMKEVSIGDRRELRLCELREVVGLDVAGQYQTKLIFEYNAAS